MKPKLLFLCFALMATGTQAQLLRPSTELRSLNLLRSGSTQPRAADFIVAVVNSEPITNNEVRLATVRAEQQMAQRGGTMPPRAEIFRMVLERLINERVQAQLARESGIKIDDLAVDQAAENVARQNSVSLDDLKRRLESEGMSYSRFRSDLRNELAINRLRERDVEPRVRITELEIDQFIREKQESGDGSAVELNIAQILIAVPEDATEAQVAQLSARAQRAYDRARAGEDFSALARELSDSPDKVNGGQMGLRTADRYPQLFVDTVIPVAAGGVAAPIRSGAGFHVLKVLEKKQAGLPGVNVVQTRARHILLRTGAQLSESAATERMTALRQRITGGEDFAAVARENGQDGTAREGGDLGWTNPGVFVPEFEEVMNGLAPGQLSQPFVSRFGVHLLQVTERRQNKLSEREQRGIARNMLREKKLDEAYEQWAQELRGRAYVEYREPPQ